MQAGVRTAFLVGLVGAGACHTTDNATPDGGGDGSSAQSGLVVPWVTNPTIPGKAQDTLTVDKLVFRMDSVRVVGDAGPGDPRTTLSTFTLTWSDSQTPSAIDFISAPTGLYSEVLILADGQLIDYSYEVEGNVQVNGTTYPYKIHDRNPLGVSLSMTATLEPGIQANVPVSINVTNALGAIDFAAISPDDGKLELDTFDSQMSNFRSKLMESFSIQSNE